MPHRIHRLLHFLNCRALHPLPPSSSILSLHSLPSAPLSAQDLEFLIEKAVDTSKADYAVFTGVQVGPRESKMTWQCIWLRDMQGVSGSQLWEAHEHGNLFTHRIQALHLTSPRRRSTTGQRTCRTRAPPAWSL